MSPGTKVQVTTKNATEPGTKPATQVTTQTATSTTEVQVTAREGKLHFTLSPAPDSAPVQISGATIRKL